MVLIEPIFNIHPPRFFFAPSTSKFRQKKSKNAKKSKNVKKKAEMQKKAENARSI